MSRLNIRKRIWLPFLLELLATAAFVLTAWTARTTHSASLAIAGFRIDPSSTLTVLSISQGLLAAILTAVLSSLYEIVQWTLIARKNGLSSITALGISATTGALGSLRLIFSRRCRLSERLWPLLRLIFTVALWVSGVTLFANTKMGVAYESVFDYNATAGVGQFNGSYVDEYIGNLQDREAGYPFTVVPYWMQAIVNNLVTSPMHAVTSIPVPIAACAEHDCDSYLLPGGLINMSPWPPTNHPAAPVIQVDNAPSIQLDFRSDISQEDVFSDEDCNIYGSETSWVGIRFCVSKSPTVDNSFAAGLYVCLEGAWNGTCGLGSASFFPNLTTTFSIFTRRTTFITARSNMSITSVTSSSSPTQLNTLDIPTFRAAISWILDFNASNIPSPTSIAQQFYSSQSQLQNTYWSPILIQTFHSLLAFPFWFFNPNNLGNMEGYGTGITPNLPAEFYTTASVAVPHGKIIISTAMFYTFLTLQITIHLFIWSVLAWLWITNPPVPEITSYPLFDFAVKTRLKAGHSGNGIGIGGGGDNMEDQYHHLITQDVPPAKIVGASDGDVLSLLEGCTYTVRSGDEVLSLAGSKAELEIRPALRTSTW